MGTINILNDAGTNKLTLEFNGTSDKIVDTNSIAIINNVIGVDANNRVSTTDMIATQSFRIGDDAHWKIRPNSGNQELCFEYATSNLTSDANIKARFTQNGHLLTPYQPMFSAYGNSGGTSYSGLTLIPYPNVVDNIGGHYSGTTSRFTAPIAGVYYFSASMLEYPTATSDYLTFFLSVNNSTYTASYPMSRATLPAQTSIMTAGFIKLNQNDYVNVYVIGTGSYYTNSGHAHFSGMLMG